MSEPPGGGKRRLIGFILLGSAGFMAILAAGASGETFGLDAEASRTVATILGAVAFLDASLGAYFVLSAARDHD